MKEIFKAKSPTEKTTSMSVSLFSRLEKKFPSKQGSIEIDPTPEENNSQQCELFAKLFHSKFGS
jgi:hypothetical protein